MKISKNRKIVFLIALIAIFAVTISSVIFIYCKNNTINHDATKDETVNNIAKEENKPTGKDSTFNTDILKVKESNAVKNKEDSNNIKNQLESNKNMNTTKKENQNVPVGGGTDSIDNSITSKGKDFSNWNKTCPWNLILLNDENEIPQGTASSIVKYGDAEVNERVLPYLETMIKDAKKDNINLWVSSCYRSIKKQDYLYNKKVNYYTSKGYSKKESEKLAQKVVAKPKTSEHNLGLAVDFNGVKDDFYLTKEYKWLLKNAAKHGFILRYKEEKKDITNKIYEPWHFRYIGKEHAINIEKLNMCLEEYIDYLKA